MIFDLVPFFKDSNHMHKSKVKIGKALSLEGGLKEEGMEGKSFVLPESKIQEILSSGVQDRQVIILDTWSNKATSRLIELAPSGTRVILVGNLSEKKSLTLCSSDFFIQHKCIEGFNLIKYLTESLSQERMNEFFRIIRDDFDKYPTSGDLFRF